MPTFISLETYLWPVLKNKEKAAKIYIKEQKASS